MGTPPALIHAEETGTAGGRLVVLVHGSLDRSAGFARVARVLQPHCRVLRYDRRGYGRSWPHPGPFAVKDQVDDLEDLLAGRPAVVVGHSYGGNVALAAAARLGSRIEAAAIYETPMSWQPWWPPNTAGGAAATSSPGDAAEAFMRRLIGDEAWEGLPARTRAERRREGIALQSELSLLRASAPWSAGDITQRVICANGSRASAHHSDAMARLAGELPRGEHVVIDGAGHNAPNSHPVDFAEQVILPLLR